MNKYWPTGSICGILAVAAYIAMGFTAYLFYPVSYSPLTNSLSQLGSPPLNPSGDIFYNLGGILLGLLLLPFYLGMSLWNTGGRSQKMLIAGAQTAGIASSLALISSCIFPVGAYTPVHAVSAGIAGTTSMFFWIFSGFALLKNPARIKWLPYFGYLPLASILFLVFALKQRFLVEWVAVGLFLLYVILLCLNAKAMSRVSNPGRAE
jgi:hypothetical protein